MTKKNKKSEVRHAKRATVVALKVLLLTAALIGAILLASCADPEEEKKSEFANGIKEITGNFPLSNFAKSGIWAGAVDTAPVDKKYYIVCTDFGDVTKEGTGTITNASPIYSPRDDDNTGSGTYEVDGKVQNTVVKVWFPMKDGTPTSVDNAMIASNFFILHQELWSEYFKDNVASVWGRVAVSGLADTYPDGEWGPGADGTWSGTTLMQIVTFDPDTYNDTDGTMKFNFGSNVFVKDFRASQADNATAEDISGSGRTQLVNGHEKFFSQDIFAQRWTTFTLQTAQERKNDWTAVLEGANSGDPIKCGTAYKKADWAKTTLEEEL